MERLIELEENEIKTLIEELELMIIYKEVGNISETFGVVKEIRKAKIKKLKKIISKLKEEDING